mmetsp:Transcript_141273/g.439050  ORF Transcript_141273/g.439050 Transcript_141273/m.439050 type:complete len:362 (-) Transcript_141273:30-1115(-)
MAVRPTAHEGWQPRSFGLELASSRPRPKLLRCRRSPNPSMAVRPTALALAAVVLTWLLPCTRALRSGRAPSVVVVQGTNRPAPQLETLDPELLAEMDRPVGTLSDWLGALQTAEYARRHGYAYKMYRYKDTYNGACWHPERGPLLAQWCKIAALRLAYADHPESDTFVWLDTDVTIMQLDWSIQKYLREQVLLEYDNVTDWTVTVKNCSFQDPSRDRSQYSVFASRNANWRKWEGHCGPNSGVMIFKRSAFSDWLLEKWWSIAMGEGIPGPYDQGFIMQMYMRYPRDVAVFTDNAMGRTRKQLLVHKCGKCAWLRNRTQIFLDHHPESLLNLASLNSQLARLDRESDVQIREAPTTMRPLQ